MVDEKERCNGKVLDGRITDQIETTITYGTTYVQNPRFHHHTQHHEDEHEIRLENNHPYMAKAKLVKATSAET